MSGIMKRLVIVAVLLLAIFLGLRIWARIYPNWLWFSSESIGLSSVFWTILKTKLGLGIGFGLIFLVLTFGNFYLLWRLALHKAFSEDSVSIAGGQIALGRNMILGVVILICIIFSFIAGFSASNQWEPYLRFVNSDQLSFSQIDPANYKDPIFNKDIALAELKKPPGILLSVR